MKRLLFLFLFLPLLAFGQAGPIYINRTNGVGSQLFELRNAARTKPGFRFIYDGTTNASGFIGGAPQTIFSATPIVQGTNNWVIGSFANSISSTIGSVIVGGQGNAINDTVSSGGANLGHAIIGSSDSAIKGGFNNVIIGAKTSEMRGVISVSTLIGEDSIMDVNSDIAAMIGGERNYMTNCQGGIEIGTGLGMSNQNYNVFIGAESNYMVIDPLESGGVIFRSNNISKARISLSGIFYGNGGGLTNLQGGSGIPTMDGSGTNTALYKDEGAGAVKTFDSRAMDMWDGNGVIAVKWAERQLVDDSGNLALSWLENARALSTSGGTALDWNDENNVVTGTGVNISQIGSDNTVTAAGTAATLTGTMATLDFGTTDPETTTLNGGGGYFFDATGTLKFNGATYAANQTITVQVFGSASTTVHASQVITTPIITTVTDNAGTFALSGFIPSATSSETLQVRAQLSATPAAGSVQCLSAKITCYRIK